MLRHDIERNRDASRRVAHRVGGVGSSARRCTTAVSGSRKCRLAFAGGGGRSNAASEVASRRGRRAEDGTTGRPRNAAAIVALNSSSPLRSRRERARGARPPVESKKVRAVAARGGDPGARRDGRRRRAPSRSDPRARLAGGSAPPPLADAPPLPHATRTAHGLARARSRRASRARSPRRLQAGGGDPLTLQDVAALARASPRSNAPRPANDGGRRSRVAVVASDENGDVRARLSTRARARSRARGKALAAAGRRLDAGYEDQRVGARAIGAPPASLEARSRAPARRARRDAALERLTRRLGTRAAARAGASASRAGGGRVASGARALDRRSSRWPARARGGAASAAAKSASRRAPRTKTPDAYDRSKRAEAGRRRRDAAVPEARAPRGGACARPSSDARRAPRGVALRAELESARRSTRRDAVESVDADDENLRGSKRASVRLADSFSARRVPSRSPRARGCSVRPPPLESRRFRRRRGGDLADFEFPSPGASPGRVRTGDVGVSLSR